MVFIVREKLYLSPIFAYVFNTRSKEATKQWQI